MAWRMSRRQLRMKGSRPFQTAPLHVILKALPCELFLLLALLIHVAAPRPARATTLTLGAKQDAWIDATSVTQNKGTDTKLRVRSSGPVRHTLIQFDVSSIPGGSCVSAATLKMK